MIIAIDGPAGSGKSSTARAVAERLGFRHLDSGAFYRALTLSALEEGREPESWTTLSTDDLEGFGIAARPLGDRFQLTRKGRVLGDELRGPEVNRYVSEMARIPEIREWLLQLLRKLAEGENVVMDGRDIGTVVFPNAELKIFLTARPEVRAARRLAEFGEQNPSEDELQAEIERLLERDRIDSEREVAPLKKADDAISVDTSDLTFTEQVEEIVRLARERS